MTETRSNEPRRLFGRRKIFASIDSFDETNILSEVNSALAIHTQNLSEEEYLYWYRRGWQPILERQKNVRPEINYKVVENHADEIVNFKDGYFLTKPVYYIARNKKANAKVRKLNEYLYRGCKADADNAAVDWAHTVGKGVIYIRPNDDDDCPFMFDALDPRCAFVVYSLKPGNEPVMGINLAVVGKTVYIDCFTRDRVYRFAGGTVEKGAYSDFRAAYEAKELIAIEPNVLGEIPIVEYQYNNVNMGAFESVITLLDAMNLAASDRINGVAQFIQSLMILYNCRLEDGQTANDIREMGLIELSGNGDAKADIKILSEQLNQSETQTLVDYMYQQVLTICGMPSTTKGGTSTSDTGAAVLARDGWYQADCVARNTEDLFRKSNRYIDRIICKIMNARFDMNIKVSDFELHFDRTETQNLLVKTQGALNLKQLGFSPELTFAKSGVSNDPVNDVAVSKDYIDMAWGLNDQGGEQGEQLHNGNGYWVKGYWKSESGQPTGPRKQKDEQPEQEQGENKE